MALTEPSNECWLVVCSVRFAPCVDATIYIIPLLWNIFLLYPTIYVCVCVLTLVRSCLISQIYVRML